MAAFLAHFFWSRCLVCGQMGPGERFDSGCCPECRQELRVYQGGFCPGCGLVFALNDPVSLCSQCRQQPRPWDGFGFYGPYQGVLRDLILKYKFHGGFGYTRLLQSLTRQAYLQHLDPYVPDCILPVPLHPARLSARGFNQSLELGRGLAKYLGVKIVPQGLVRLQPTKPQTGLHKKEREKNVQGVFAGNQDVLGGKTILLLDDIYTTGATVTACARALVQAKAEQVKVLVLARALET